MKSRSIKSLVRLAILLLCAPSAWAQEEASVLAVVDGTPLTRAEVRAAATDEFEDLENDRLRFEADSKSREHEIIQQTLDELITERLLQTEAEERGIARSALLEIEVEANVPEPAESEVQDVYNVNRQQLLNLSLEEGLQRVREFLTERSSELAFSEFVERLKREHEVETHLEPYRVEVETEDFPASGPDDAPVTIVEFSDFECPFCRQALPTLNQIKENYSDRIRVVFRQFPLNDIHPRAQKAAEASLCADDQGAFWTMHDLLFAEPIELEVASLKEKAASLGLDTETFGACLDSAKYAGRVRQEIKDGIRAGVSGTPTVFINGRPLTGVHAYAVYAEIIEEELALVGSEDE